MNPEFCPKIFVGEFLPIRKNHHIFVDPIRSGAAAVASDQMRPQEIPKNSWMTYGQWKIPL